jgi:hypothetical protein
MNFFKFIPIFIYTVIFGNVIKIIQDLGKVVQSKKKHTKTLKDDYILPSFRFNTDKLKFVPRICCKNLNMGSRFACTKATTSKPKKFLKNWHALDNPIQQFDKSIDH